MPQHPRLKYRALMAELLCRRYAYEVAKGLPHAEFKDKPSKATYKTLQHEVFWVDLPETREYRWCFTCNQCLPSHAVTPFNYKKYLICKACHYKPNKTTTSPLYRVMHAGQQNAKGHGATADELLLWRKAHLVENMVWNPWVAKHPDLPKYLLQRIDPESAPTPSNYRLILKKRG